MKFLLLILNIGFLLIWLSCAKPKPFLPVDASALKYLTNDSTVLFLSLELSETETKIINASFVKSSPKRIDLGHPNYTQSEIWYVFQNQQGKSIDTVYNVHPRFRGHEVFDSTGAIVFKETMIPLSQTFIRYPYRKNEVSRVQIFEKRVAKKPKQLLQIQFNQ